jgi:protoporphyrin/coproporphyrin ferrochelatase
MTFPSLPGALLMTYGSPASLEREDVEAYLTRVRGGRASDVSLVDEFTRRYRLIGGSPLITVTRAQADALAEALGWPVEVGMRFSEPSIETGLLALADAGATQVAAITLSPQHSALLMGGYDEQVQQARTTLQAPAPEVRLASAWPEEPSFIDGLARRVSDSLDTMSSEERRRVGILMTAHSVPRRVTDREPEYLAQLRATAEAVAARAGLTDGAWRLCWQSAGHEPGEWMKPDFADLMPELASTGVTSVLVVPVQFLADHLEILYDIDIAARDQAERHGLTFRRIESLNADPSLIGALASVARRTVTTTA